MHIETTLEKQFMGKATQLLPLMYDDSISDILINGTTSLFVERNGNLESLETPFREKQSLQDLIERMLIPIGKRIDAAQPYADGRLSDGSRFHIILPPIALEGPLISIRRQKKRERVQLKDFGSPETVEFLISEVKAEKNILIAGGTGVGKTTLLSLLLEQAAPESRIAVVEETSEIRAEHPHLIHLEARGASPEGLGEVTLRTLVKNALRMRPDRLVLGECRGAEAFDMLQAMNTGHRGSLGTIHANSGVDGLKRLESLALLSGIAIPLRVVREWVGSCVQTVVFIERRLGSRQVAEIITVHGVEGENFRIRPRFKTGL